jgi:peptidoglycan/LPS O-acetylase OafA/YrhL
VPFAKGINTNVDRSERNLGLDTMRTICVVAIVFFHTNNFLGKFTSIYKTLFPIGYLLQELFFGLSGFLVGRQILKHINQPKSNLNLITFYKNRWLRTVPLYFMFIIINFILLKTIYIYSLPHFNNLLFNVFNYFLFTQNLFTQHPYFFPEIWPLPIEEWSFLVLPIPIFTYNYITKKNMTLNQLLLLIFIEIVLISCLRINYILSTNPDLDWGLRKIVVYRLDSLLYGFALTLLINKFQAFFVKYKLWLMLIGFTTSVIFYYSQKTMSPYFFKASLFNVLPFFMCLMIPYFYFTSFDYVNKKLKALITHISLVSYSILLTHLYFLQFFMLSLFTPQNIIQGLVFILLYIILLYYISKTTFNYIERPLLLRRNK